MDVPIYCPLSPPEIMYRERESRLPPLFTPIYRPRSPVMQIFSEYIRISGLFLRSLKHLLSELVVTRFVFRYFTAGSYSPGSRSYPCSSQLRFILSVQYLLWTWSKSEVARVCVVMRPYMQLLAQSVLIYTVRPYVLPARGTMALCRIGSHTPYGPCTTWGPALG